MSIEIPIGENIRIWKEFNPFELSAEDGFTSFFGHDSKRHLARMGFNRERISIKGRWFDVLTMSELVRMRNSSDGYYRAIYIQINWESGEYYIGKVNRPKWSELIRYQGSGLKFVNKFKNNEDKFARYYIAKCETAENTEQLEASIVTNELLSDEKCLNLVSGGAGTTKHPALAETSEKKREYMRNHPEQFKDMLEASKKAFRKGTPALRERNKRIQEVMSAESYREMSKVRMEKWRAEKPLAYEEARRKIRKSIKSAEVQEKRMASLKKWAEENPEKHIQWQEKLLASRTSKEAKEKRKASLKNWRGSNPELAKANANKRAKAAAVKLSKQICMLDLSTGAVLKTFPSQRDAARWLVENGKAKNTNCASSISAVCLGKPCTTGYGFRKKAFGYGWRFSNETDSTNQTCFEFLWRTKE